MSCFRIRFLCPFSRLLFIQILCSFFLNIFLFIKIDRLIFWIILTIIESILF